MHPIVKGVLRFAIERKRKLFEWGSILDNLILVTGMIGSSWNILRMLGVKWQQSMLFVPEYQGYKSGAKKGLRGRGSP